MQNNIHTKGISEEDRERGPKNIFEKLMADNFPNMRKINLYIQEDQLGLMNIQRYPHIDLKPRC